VIGTGLLVLLCLTVGAQAADGVRLRQQEVILSKLAPADAATFYKVLRRRVWKVRILRAVAVMSLLVILYVRNRV
jgi:hypothetical protein